MIIEHKPPGHHSWRAMTVRRVIREVIADEARYLLHGDRHDPVYLPWMPFQWADFIAILAECVAESDGDAFCDVGAGAGTKMRLARSLFGLHADGYERDGEMAAYAAETTGGTVIAGDALDAPEGFWARYDIIWMYRPLRDRDRERQLEQRVYAGMRRGAVFAGASLEAFPAGWHIVVDDLDIRRGAWKKP